MKKTIFTHLLWVAVAAGAYAIGRTNSGKEVVVEREIRPSGPRLNLKSSDGGGGGDPVARKRAEWIGNLPTGNLTGAQMSDLIDRMKNESDPAKSNMLFAELLLRLTPENAEETMKALREGEGRRGGRGGFGIMDRMMGGNGNKTTMLLQAWARIDGAAAVAYAQDEMGGGRGEGGRGGRGGFGGGMSVASALSGWATQDAAAAAAWLDGQEAGREKSFYTSGLVNGMAQSDPGAATEFVLGLGEDQLSSDGDRGGRGGRGGFGINQETLLASIGQEVLKQGISEAIDWADALPEGDLKATQIDQIADSYAREDIESATQWAEDLIGQSGGEQAVRQVADEWAKTDPEAAIDWTMQLDEEVRADAMRSAFDEWTQSDVEGASQYLAEMPASPEKDSAVQGMALELDRENPEAAATWAETIADEEIRTETLSQVARTWMRVDAEAAQAWLPTSGLSSEAQTQVTAGGQDRGGRRDGGGRRGR
ncbi:MAG: hypothetical protein AAF514_19360 [Verrucomicrobiota bacterium]